MYTRIYEINDELTLSLALALVFALAGRNHWALHGCAERSQGCGAAVTGAQC